MKWLWIAVLAVNLLGQEFRAEPAGIKQGQVLLVYGSSAAQQARMNRRTVPMFPQRDGRTLGLMPVSVIARAGTYQLEWLDKTGTAIRKESIVVANAHYKTQNVVLTKRLSGLHSTSEERAKVGAFLKLETPERHWQEPLEAPLPGCITSPFGVTRLHNGKPTGEFHAGLDQRGAFGSPIHAVAGGTVKIVKKFELRGGTIAIDHGQGLESIYLHMSKFASKEGDQVNEGDVIGYVGSTGRSTGPHLHWTLYANGQAINPNQWVHGLKDCTGPRPAQPARERRR